MLRSQRCWKVSWGFAHGGNLDLQTRPRPGDVGQGTWQVVTLVSMKSSASSGTHSGKDGDQVSSSD